MARLRGFLVAAALLTLAVPAVRHLREREPAIPEALYLALPEIPGTEFGAGDDMLDAAISPDGRTIILVATRDGVAHLWRRPLGGGRPELVPGSEGASMPAWSPAGDAVAFFAEGALRQITFADGSIRSLGDAPAPAGVAFLPDGSLVAARLPAGPIERLAGGAWIGATRLHPGDRRHEFPAATGRADDFIYVAVGRDGRRAVRHVSAGRERDVAPTSGHAALAAGHLLFVRDRVLLAQPFDAERGAVTGRPQPLVTGVGTTATGRGLFAASSRVLLTAPETSRARQMTWLTADGSRLGTVSEPGDYWQLRLAPDDRLVAVTMTAPLLGTLDIFRVAIDAAGPPERLSTSIFADSHPVWAPDGRALVFRTVEGGQPVLFRRRLPSLDTPPEPLPGTDRGRTPTDWASGLLYQEESGGAAVLSVLNLETGEHTPVTRPGFNSTDGRWSPDGRWLAYVSDESGQPDVYVQPWPSGSRVRVSFGGGSKPRWSRDGRSLYFQRGDWIVRADRASNGQAAFTSAVPVVHVPGLRDFDTAHRTDRLLALVPVPDRPPAAVGVVVEWAGAVGSRR